MATRPFSLSPGAVVLSAALPLVFLHREHQFAFTLDLGPEDVSVTMADLAVVVVGVASLVAAWRGGLSRLAPGKWAWLATSGFLAWILVSTLSHAGTDGYPFSEHLVTAVKFSEYAVLAVAVPLLAPGARDLLLVLAVLALWTTVAAGVGLLQFAGWDVLDAWPAGRRQPSFLGHHSLAALAGIALATAVAGILLARSWLRPSWLVVVAATGGAASMILSGAIVGALGFVAGMVVGTAVARPRIALDRGHVLRLGALAAVVLIGTGLLRGGDLGQFGRFLGLIEARESTTEDVQSYSQRTVLVYIGLRIFRDHPVTGLGWQASSDERGYGPYVEDARARFPDVADVAFPSPEHPWGVQNAYVQALADLGAIGLALFVSVLVTGGLLAWRAVTRAPPRLAWPGLVALVLLVTVSAIWAAEGFFAGLPLAAATWLAIGIGASAAGGFPQEHGVG